MKEQADNAAMLAQISHEIGSVIKGKSDVVELLLVCVLAQGHVLLEDAPGVGKTTLAKALSASLDLHFSRIQFTPDLLPQDLLGTTVLHPHDGTFSFRKGPVFTNLLLADEINRASPRTQSALLEAMNENQVSIDQETRPLAAPFVVIATQNPVEYQGTYPLPEAQLDRFMMKLSIGYPHPSDELQILADRRQQDPLLKVRKVLVKEQLAQLQQAVLAITVSDDVAKYLLRLVERTRNHPSIDVGLSPRASLALYRACQSKAFMNGQTYVSPNDVQELFLVCMSHRIVLSSAAKYGGSRSEHLLSQIMESESVPV